MTSKTEIAKVLLRIKAVFLNPDNPFTWASGIKSPIYCDNRLILSYPEERNIVENATADKIKSLYPDAQALFGTSTAGIPHAALVSERLNLPMGYVRNSAKTHGRNNQIEGKLIPNQKVIVIEDLISTAESAIECVRALREAEAEVLGIISIFTYGMKRGLDNLAKENITNNSLCDLDTLAKTAVQENYIKPEDEKKLLLFRDNPSDESWRN